MSAGAERTVVLSDEQGRPCGSATVSSAHGSPGMLHKAFSVFVFRTDGELLVQQRAASKPLWPLFWANTCCSHPREGEDLRAAAQRRLTEECGLACDLEEAGCFVYRAEEPGGRGVEHEHDTVFAGRVDRAARPRPDPSEIAAWRWMSVERLREELAREPGRFAPWLKPGLEIALRKATRPRRSGRARREHQRS